MLLNKWQEVSLMCSIEQWQMKWSLLMIHRFIHWWDWSETARSDVLYSVLYCDSGRKSTYSYCTYAPTYNRDIKTLPRRRSGIVCTVCRSPVVPRVAAWILYYLELQYGRYVYIRYGIYVYTYMYSPDIYITWYGVCTPYIPVSMYWYILYHTHPEFFGLHSWFWLVNLVSTSRTEKDLLQVTFIHFNFIHHRCLHWYFKYFAIADS